MTARSLFTEAIEDHLALKKQNMRLEETMPLARYDVGDPLDRFPGGSARVATSDTVLVADDKIGTELETQPASAHITDQDTQFFAGPSPEQAMEAATSLEPSFGDHPFEPLSGMAPMLSLVEDIDEEAELLAAASEPANGAQPAAPESADVLRFPGGVGPRDESTGAMQLSGFSLDESQGAVATLEPETTSENAESSADDALTGEQPVLVVDTNDSFANISTEPTEAPSKRGSRRPRFFGLGRKKNNEKKSDNWFNDGPRDFNWD